MGSDAVVLRVSALLLPGSGALVPASFPLPVSGIGYRSPAYRVVKKSNQVTDTDGKALRVSQVPPSLTLIIEAKTV